MYIIPGGALGDAVLQTRCGMIFGNDVFTAVPPVSP